MKKIAHIKRSSLWVLLEEALELLDVLLAAEKDGSALMNACGLKVKHTFGARGRFAARALTL